MRNLPLLLKKLFPNDYTGIRANGLADGEALRAPGVGAFLYKMQNQQVKNMSFIDSFYYFL